MFTVSDIIALTSVIFHTPENSSEIRSFQYLRDSTIKNYIFDEEILVICPYAFMISSVINVTLNKHITEIPCGCFYGCTNLSNINLNNIKSIQNFAFYGVVIQFDIPNVNNIGTYAFYGNRFYGTNLYLTNITIIPAYSFYGTEMNSFTISSTVTRIEEGAFEVSNIYCDLIIPESVTYIGASCFNFANFNSITIPESVEEIGYGSFYYCNIQSFPNPSRIKEISSNAFAYSSIVNLYIPEGVEKLDSYCFQNCALQTLVIPSTVYYIGISAFTQQGSTYSNLIQYTEIDVTIYSMNITFDDLCFYNVKINNINMKKGWNISATAFMWNYFDMIEFDDNVDCFLSSFDNLNGFTGTEKSSMVYTGSMINDDGAKIDFSFFLNYYCNLVLVSHKYKKDNYCWVPTYSVYIPTPVVTALTKENLNRKAIIVYISLYAINRN